MFRTVVLKLTSESSWQACDGQMEGPTPRLPDSIGLGGAEVHLPDKFSGEAHASSLGTISQELLT